MLIFHTQNIILALQLVNGAFLQTVVKSGFTIFVDCGGQDGVIRLFNGSSISNGEVEFCFNSTWTPVCGDDWDQSEAAVACRQLGFAGEGIELRIDHIAQYI